MGAPKMDLDGDMVPRSEIASLVAAEVAKALESIQRAPSGGDDQWARGLAMAIADVSDQGVGRKRVAPEVIEARRRARAEMEALIADARGRGEMPIYRLINKVVLSERLIEPLYIAGDKSAQPTQIGWPNVPNEAMIPVNDVAKGIHAAFLVSIGSAGVATDFKHRLTPGGVVIMDHRATGPTVSKPADTDVMVMNGPSFGQLKATRVLGTIAAPAQQNA